MKKKIYCHIILLTFLIQYSLAQVGQSGMSFLKLGVSSRALSMGDAYSLEYSDPAAPHYNPAILSNSDNFQIMIMHREWINDTRTEFIGVQVPFKKFRFGFSINSTSISDIEIRNVPGPAEGNFTARNAAVGISAAYSFDKLFFGITGKFLYEKILIDEASGYAFDFGTVYKTPFGFNVGLSLNNIGAMNKLRDEASSLPTMIRFGATKVIDIENLNSTIIPTLDVVSFFKEKKTHIHTGAEFSYEDIFFVRGGIQTGYKARFFSMGTGIRYNIFNIDYAFVPFKYDFGSTHTFSIIVNL